jgi:hypothetical protein
MMPCLVARMVTSYNVPVQVKKSFRGEEHFYTINHQQDLYFGVEKKGEKRRHG